MSYIYKITNDINDKIYVGKTSFSIEKRFKEHCRDAYRDRNEKRPLYNAMVKYGIQHFKISLIEKCLDEEASLKEIYWIGYYKSYTNGYNATLGGDGKFKYDHQQILKELQKIPNATIVAKKIGCCRDIVAEVARQNNIQLTFNNPDLRDNAYLKKAIQAITKDNKIVKQFTSTSDAAKWCYEEKKCATLNSGVRSHIAECANGKRKTAYGYIWKYL